MLYHWYEMAHAAVSPVRVAADGCRMFFENPFNPMTHTPAGRHAAAACQVFERTTRRYDKPAFGIRESRSAEVTFAVHEKVVWERHFCRLIHFGRSVSEQKRANDPRVLLVAPMSGHFATLLRGTVEVLLPDHEVFITDWQDARDVQLSKGRFDLDDSIDYIRDMLTHFGGDVHVFAVCQPSVPVLAAVALMEADGDPNVPRSMILAGGPIDTRVSPTEVNRIAERRGLSWFRNNAISVLPWNCAGAGREIYPGFLQLTGFMAMNADRHARAHKDLFLHLVHGDGDSAKRHREFYDEYLAVMDLTAEFFLQTVETVFLRHALPRGEMRHRGRLIEPSAIRHVALMTVEGEKDDITGLGQCAAAHSLCTGIPLRRKSHFECKGVGHYGVFNGSRFRNEIAPRLAAFMRENDLDRAATERSQNAVAGFDQMGVRPFLRDFASLAFTFAAANDSGEANHGTAAQGATALTRASSPQSAPFQLFAMAGHMIIDGMFRLHGFR